MTNQEEIWKDIPGYEGRYKVSSLGRIKSLKRMVNFAGHEREVEEKIREGVKSRNGYWRITLSKDYKNKTYTIHSIVAKAFIPNPENLPCINHINSDKDDNSVANLEWISHKNNTRHYYLNTAKNITPKEKVVELFELFKRGYNINEVSRISGITKTTIHGYLYGERVVYGIDFSAFRVLKKHKYKGVIPYGDKWRARVTINGKRHYLGNFNTEDEAIAACENFKNRREAA